MGIRTDGWWKPKEEGDYTRPIHFATHNRHLIKFHLEKFQNPNVLDVFGRSPLIIACLTKARKREIKTLLDCGADVNFLWETKNPYYKLSPLAIVIHFQDMEMAKYLLTRGADPNFAVFNGFTPLHLAIIYQQPDLIGWLVDVNADTNAKDDFGYTPLHLAALSSKQICKKLLDMEETNIASCGCDGETPLHIAAYENRLDIVKLLVERHANIEHEMRGHFTPVLVSPSNSVVRKYLLDQNAKCDKCLEHEKVDWIPFNCYLPSPLKELLKAVKPLLTLQRNEVFNKFKHDPEKFKISAPKIKVGKPLDPQCPTVIIEPPWYWIPPVTNFPNLGILFIVSTALKNASNKKNSSYEYVKKKFENEMILEQKDHFPSLMQLIHLWGSFTVNDRTLLFAGYCLSLLIDVGVDVNKKNKNGYTPLFALIEDGYESAACFLLDNGADPNLKVNGITPLMMASVRGLKEVVFALLEKGADVNAQDKYGISALHLACYYALFNPPEIVEALIAKGAEVNGGGPSSLRPLHLSAISMSTDRCRILLNAGAYIDAKVFGVQAVDLAFLFMNIPAAAILKLSGDMFKSALRCDLDLLEKYLKRGAIVNCQRENYGTLLMCVTDIPLTLFVILILKFEPDYEIKDCNGLTAIHHAVDDKNYLTLAVFLKKWGVEMLFRDDSHHHIDVLIKLCEDSETPDWMCDGEMLYILKSWKVIYEVKGKKSLEQMINAHFYDYVGFATLMFKFGWRKAMQYLRTKASLVSN